MKSNKNNTIKKSEGFILILILLVFFFVHDHEEYPKKIDNFANNMFGHIESLERQNRLLFKTVETLLEDSKNNQLLEELCTGIIEDETNPITIAKGYDCLAKVNSNKQDQASIYQAIKNESYALEASYKPEYLSNLFKYITSPLSMAEDAKPITSSSSLTKDANPITSASSLTKDAKPIASSSSLTRATNPITSSSSLTRATRPEIGDLVKNITRDDELKILNELSSSDIKDVKARALYRLSLINSLGRKSSLEDYNYNFEEANNLRNQVIQLTNFNKKKYIDVLFSLNNNPKYIQYAKTTIASILLNSDLDSEYRFYVLSDAEDPFSAINQNQLSSLQKISPYTIKFITMPKKFFENKEGFKDLKTRVIFSRVLAESLLTHLDSIISLDVDIIVLRDLYNLQHHQELNNFVLMGAIEGQKTRDKALCGFPYTYINIGVTIQNLKLMRQMNNSELVLDKYQEVLSSKDSKCLLLPEQDLMNVLYKNQIGFISKRWNYVTALDFNTKFMPFIIHYAGKHAKAYNELSFEYLKTLHIKYQEFANNLIIK